MAGTLLPPSWTPIGSLYATVGTPFTQTFTYARSDIDGNPLEVDIGFVTTSGGSTYLSNGSTVFPGVVTQSNSPDNSCSITISGTPTLVGTYTIYAKGNFGTGYTPKTYTVSVTGGSALTTLPLSGTVSPSAQQGGEYVSSAFVILNGSSNYILTLTGAPASIGLSSNPTPGSGVTSLTTTSNTFYLVNKSSMVPTSGEVGSSTITINVHDNISGAADFAPTFTFVVDSSSGTLSITATTGGTVDCVQEHTFSRTYTVSGGNGFYTWSIVGGSLPTGVTQTSTGNTSIISGVPTGNVTNPGGISYPFNVHVVDSASGVGDFPVTLTVLPSASYTGGPLPSSCPINTAYPPTTLTVIGGDGIGTNCNWRIFGLPSGMSFAQGSTDVGPYKVVTGKDVTFQGTPNTAGSYTIIATPYSAVGLSLFPGDPVSFPLSISGVSDLTIGPDNLGSGWVQNQSNTVGLTAVGGGGGDAYAWVVSGLPSGITYSGGSTSTTNLTGFSTIYGTYSVPVSVTDSTLTKTGSKTYTLVVAPDIWVDSGLTSGHLTDGVKGSSYTDAVVFIGGDNVGFEYTVSGLPGEITTTTSGAGNNTLTFHTNTITSLAGTYAVSVNVTVNTVNTGGTTSKLFPFNLTISGSGTVILVPFTATLRTGDGKAFSAPKVKIGAVVTGGSTNTYSISPPSGWNPQGGNGPFSSNFATTYVQTSHLNGDYPFTLTSDEDGLASQTVIVTVYTGSTSDPTVTCSNHQNGGLGYNMYSGDSNNFVASMPGTNCNSHGTWYLSNGEIPAGVTFNPSSQHSGAMTVNVTSAATAYPQTLVLNYQPDEDPDRPVQVYINLVPGVKPPTNNFYINTASLPDGAATVAYNQTLSTSGGTLPALYNPPGGVTWQSLPSPLVLNSSGVISGTPTISSSTILTITARDSRATPYWTSKTFALTVTSGGGTPTITSIAPNFGPIGGGTSVVVTGTNFVTGDILTFVVPSTPGFLHASATGNIVSGGGTILTSTTPAWGYGAGLVSAGIIRSSIEVTEKSGAFTFGGADFSVGTFSPAFATVGDPDKVIHVFGSNFDASCSIRFTRNDGGGEQTLSSQLFNNSGDISGTIAAANFTTGHAGKTAQIKVVKGDGSFSTSSNLFDINGTNLDITTASLASATRTASYSQALSASGGSGTGYSWAIAPGTNVQPPTGITLHSDGTLTGTVDALATSSTPTFRVTDSVGNIKDKAIQILVIGGVLTITTLSPLPNANINSLYGKHIVASGGVLPYTFTRTSGAIPLGLNLGTDGNLNGTPTTGNSAPSDFSFSVLVTDSTSVTPLTATALFSLHLDPAISVVTVDSLNPAAGPITGGIPVTITGTGFVNGCTVQFGATTATAVQFVSGTSIIATTPPHAAEAVTVSVRNPDGGNGVKSSFLYQVLSFPNITNIDKQDGPFAGGQTVTLSGSNFQGISAIQFISANNIPVAASFDPSNVSLGSSPQTVIITTPPGFTFGDGSVAVGATISVTNASGTGTWALGPNGYMYRPPPIITSVVPNTGPTSGGQTVYVIGSNFFQRGAIKPRVFIGNVEIPASSIILKEQ